MGRDAAGRPAHSSGSLATNAAVDVDVLLFESRQIHALPTLLAARDDALLRAATAGAVTLAVATHDLPRTFKETAKISAFISVFASILILVPFAFVAASFVTPLVRERESGSKQMQFISGVSPLTYWLASWTWDLLLLAAVLAATLGVFLMMGRSEFTGTPTLFGATALLLACFGTAAIGFASVASFGFKSPSSALIALIALHFITGFGLLITDFILLTINEGTERVDKKLRAGLFPLFPAYCLGRGFFVLSTRQAIATLDDAELEPLFAWGQLGAPLTFLLLETLATAALTLAIQVLGSYPRLARTAAAAVAATLPASVHGLLPASLQAAASAATDGGAHGATAVSLEDASVAEERAAIDAALGGAAGEGAVGPVELVLRHLHKRYGGVGGKVAVRDLCLRVHSGECFGFLGVNGAGKSTTFAMLTGSAVPSSGDALLHGLSVLSEQDAIRRLVGFCPQHDALESLLTARETLVLYCRIKGVPPAAVGAEVDALLRDLDLIMFADKQAGTLSGGNKRKLCVGIALVGSPKVPPPPSPTASRRGGSPWGPLPCAPPLAEPSEKGRGPSLAEPSPQSATSTCAALPPRPAWPCLTGARAPVRRAARAARRALLGHGRRLEALPLVGHQAAHRLVLHHPHHALDGGV